MMLRATNTEQSWVGRATVLVLFLMAVGLVTLWFAAPARAATFNATRTDDPTPNGCQQGDCSLREAVIAANNTQGFDTIMLQPTTYTLSIPLFGPDASTGDLDTTENLDIKVAGPDQATVDANSTVTNDRAFEVQSGGASLYNVNVTGGIGTPADANGLSKGGGIRVDSGVLYMYGGSVRSNNAGAGPSDGGGIYNLANVHLRRVELVGNQAGFRGGAIFTGEGAFTDAYDTKFFDNQGSDGGAISGPGTTNIYRSQFSSNFAEDGGAVWAGSAPGSGGSGGTYDLINTTINTNTASDVGGALRARNGTISLENSTVTRNSSPDGGGIAAKDDLNDGHPTLVTLHNTILAGNIDTGNDNPDCFDPDALVGTHVESNGYNIVGRAEGCLFAPVTGDQVGSSIFPVDPLLDPSEHFNGGAFVRVFTDAPLPGSPAIDKGDPASGACEMFDARGVPRTLGGRCDIGAYELVKCQTTVVNRVGTFGDDSSTTPELTPTSGADGFLGLDGKDTLQGADGSDALCGGNGGDTLSGGPASDFLLGQSGNDTLTGGKGGDHFSGGDGGDTINARDNQSDTIACGAGTDHVFADRSDKVARDCERVSRQ
jgi:hypothetical protein